MKTLKEPQEPFRPPFLLPLSPLSRRRHVAFLCVQSTTLSFFEREKKESVFCPETLSLSLSLLQQRARDQITKFFRSKSTKSASSFPAPPKGCKISRVFSFFVSTATAGGIWIKKIRKNRDI